MWLDEVFSCFTAGSRTWAGVFGFWKLCNHKDVSVVAFRTLALEGVAVSESQPALDGFVQCSNAGRGGPQQSFQARTGLLSRDLCVLHTLPARASFGLECVLYWNPAARGGAVRGCGRTADRFLRRVSTRTTGRKSEAIF